MSIIPVWLEDWMRQYSLLDAALTVIAIIFAIRLIWGTAKRWWPGLLVFIEFVKALGRLPDFMQSTDSTLAMQGATLAEHGEMLAVVKHEVLPNHGGSLRDEVTTLGLQHEQTKAKLTKDHSRFEAIERVLNIRNQARRASLSNSAKGGEGGYLEDPHIYPSHDAKEE